MRDEIAELVEQGRLISTREVFNELERQAVSTDILQWAKDNKAIFTTPGADELRFVAEIFSIRVFNRLSGSVNACKACRLPIRL